MPSREQIVEALHALIVWPATRLDRRKSIQDVAGQIERWLLEARLEGHEAGCGFCGTFDLHTETRNQCIVGREFQRQLNKLRAGQPDRKKEGV